jgi:RNA recognition motif-containing protein
MDPSPVIYVRNLPWSTSNEDLIELFTTIGKVERAEIQYEHNGRSRGTGVVEFGSQDDAATAITKFQQYMYGGRPLGLSYVKYNNQTNTAVAPMDVEPNGSLQEQIM